MLPLLRVLPLGGVVLAVLILLLALTPPDGAQPRLHRVAMDARGPLQDREEHPEWRQFFILAAFRRAEAVDKLRELPSAPTKLPEIVVPLPEAPPITITPAVTAVPSMQSIAAIAPADQPAPAPALSSAPEPAADLSAPAIEEQPTDVASLPPGKIETPAVASASTAEPNRPPESPVDVPLPQASSGKARIPVPVPVAAPAALRKFAGLPVERNATDPTPEEVTGSIDNEASATIPIEIGETSSTELPIILPPERPPILRKPVRQKNSQTHKPKRGVARAKAAAKPQPQKQSGLFDVWFGGGKTEAKQPAAETGK